MNGILIITLAVVVMLKATLDPFITGALITGGISLLGGRKSDEEANKRQSEAISAQNAWEAANAKRAQEQMALADHLLYGGIAPMGPWQEQQDAERKRLFERSIAHLPPDQQQQARQRYESLPIDQRGTTAPAFIDSSPPGDYMPGGQGGFGLTSPDQATRLAEFQRSIAGAPEHLKQSLTRDFERRESDRIGGPGMRITPMDSGRGPQDGVTWTPQGQQPGQSQGALQQAQSWTDNYLSWLQNSPDITYNAQRGRMEGDIRASMEAAARSLGRRGLASGDVQSGVAGRDMADISMARAGMMGQMEAGRHDRRGERLGMGTQLTQGLVDRALNLRSAAMGTAMNQQTAIPGMLMGQAQQHSGQAGGWGQLTGAALDYGLQSLKPRVQVPTTAPQQAGNQWHDYLTPGKMGQAWGGLATRTLGY